VREVAEVVARLRGIGIDELAAATTANARRLFGIA
jgi:Tat protein secretion system quality control protein TatD with DNase activity